MRQSDVVHLHDFLYPANLVAWAAARLARRPLVVTQHIGMIPYRNRALRALLAEYAEARAPGERGPVRGLARLLRRNPTEAERMLWDGLTTDRRFAGKGIKRQVPVGTHITDFVSFPLRLVIAVVPGSESEPAAKARGDRRAWLTERGYRVLDVEAGAIEADLPAVLDRLAAALDHERS